jgi:hypothetical protein
MKPGEPATAPPANAELLIKKLLFVAAGFSLRLHRRDAYATGLIAT